MVVPNASTSRRMARGDFTPGSRSAIGSPETLVTNRG
jgi:hypothetical protein